MVAAESLVGKMPKPLEFALQQKIKVLMESIQGNVRVDFAGRLQAHFVKASARVPTLKSSRPARIAISIKLCWQKKAP